MDRPRMVTRLIASRSTARFRALRTRTSLKGFLPLTLAYLSSSLCWSMPMKMVRVSMPSSTFRLGVLRRQVRHEIDVAGEQCRDARLIGLDRRVHHVGYVALELVPPLLVCREHD